MTMDMSIMLQWNIRCRNVPLNFNFSNGNMLGFKSCQDRVTPKGAVDSSTRGVFS